MTELDFVDITNGGELCDANGELGPAEFELVMRRQARARTHPHTHTHGGHVTAT